MQFFAIVLFAASSTTTTRVKKHLKANYVVIVVGYWSVGCTLNQPGLEGLKHIIRIFVDRDRGKNVQFCLCLTVRPPKRALSI